MFVYIAAHGHATYMLYVFIAHYVSNILLKLRLGVVKCNFLKRLSAEYPTINKMNESRPQKHSKSFKLPPVTPDVLILFFLLNLRQKNTF